MPGPVSVTDTSTSLTPSDIARPTVPPSGVHWIAFARRLETIWRTRSPSVTRTTPSMVDSSSVRPARLRLRLERRVRALAEDAHVDFLAQDREAPRVELREVEDVTDEPLEPSSLLGDDVERAAPRLLVLEHAVAQRRDVTANRRQRRPQLVRDGHEEVARQLLRLREPRRHLAEPRAEALDLAVRRPAREARRRSGRQRPRRLPRVSASSGRTIRREK